MFEVFAFRYATMGDRVRAQNLMACAPEDAGTAMPMDYFFWVLRAGKDAIVVDTGAAHDTLVRRGRTPLLNIEDALRRFGLDPSAVCDVILTHLHYDHAGGTGLFPRGQFHLQSRELAFARGPAMHNSLLSWPYEELDLTRIEALQASGRVVLHEGAHELRPGIELRLVGGHTGGTQIVRVRTARGWLVLASDAMHFRANALAASPFPTAADVDANLASHELCYSLADRSELVIPGHDPDTVRTLTPHLGLPNVFRLA